MDISIWLRSIVDYRFHLVETIEPNMSRKTPAEHADATEACWQTAACTSCHPAAHQHGTSKINGSPTLTSTRGSVCEAPGYRLDRRRFARRPSWVHKRSGATWHPSRPRSCRRRSPYEPSGPSGTEHRLRKPNRCRTSACTCRGKAGRCRRPGRYGPSRTRR